MKNKIKTAPVIILLIIVFMGFGNCADDSYLKDGGISTPYYDGTILDFLKSRADTSDPDNYFSDLIDIIEFTEMEEVFGQDDITFFAPTNWSIRKSLNFLNQVWYQMGNDSVKSIRQIKPVVWEEYLSMYILKEKYLLKDIPQIDTTAIAAYPGQTFVSFGGLPMNAGVVYNDANGVKYAGPRQILFSYIYDITVSDLKNAYVATSDIQPTNGAIHVIRLTDHDFGFDKIQFALRAIEEGIEELTDNSTE